MSELRRDPISGRWVIIAEQQPAFHDKEESGPCEEHVCPFCPGQEAMTPPEIMGYSLHPRSPNTGGWTLRVIPSRSPLLQIEGELGKQGVGVFDRMSGIGAHEVIIETPDHYASLSTLKETAFEDVLWAYRDRMLDLRRDERFRYIMVFKNHGKRAGARVEHSHSQLIALPITPQHVSEEVDGAKKYFSYRDRCAFCDIVQQELNAGTRVITENEEFVGITPYASRFPFEIWLLPKAHEPSYDAGDRLHVRGLARIFSEILHRVDRALDSPAYNFILHTSPFQLGANPYFHWHFEIIPRLLGMAGFEWGSGFHINPTPPESAARHLRETVNGRA